MIDILNYNNFRIHHFFVNKSMFDNYSMVQNDLKYYNF